jgi:RNA polymerase sigma factor (sigma-70 family)
MPAAKDKAEADRRALYFDLIEDHLDTLYDTVRRELTYLECSGSVPEGYLSVRDLVDATILKGLERFQDRPTAFSVGDWLTQLALESIEAEARAARRAVPEDAASLDVEPEAPAEEPTEADQEIFEFYQADEVLRLEDLVSDRTAVDPEAATERHETALALHRAIGDLPTLWRRVLFLVDLGGAAPERAARVLGLSRDEMLRILDATRAYLRQKLQDFGETSGTVERILDPCANGISPMPQPLADRQRLRRFLVGLDNGEAT